MMKGLILAGGSGTRLYPVTMGVSKQLLPVYDKPMIYYPLSVLMLAGIRDIMVISTREDMPNFKRLLGDGSDFGVSLSYIVQDEPKGLAHAFLLCEEFIQSERVCLILGDNLLYGQGLVSLLHSAVSLEVGASIFGYYIEDPRTFGVVELNAEGKPISIEEKPKEPKSNLAVTGLYFFDNKVIDFAKKLKPSPRGELEITDINRLYLNQGNLHVNVLGRGCVWLDMGTHGSLMEASQYIRAVETRQGLKIGCIEEIGLRNGWVNRDQVKEKAKLCSKTAYGDYLLKVVKHEEVRG